MQNTLATAPIRPDFHLCGQSLSISEYPAPIRLADCLQALALMPQGAELDHYHQPNDEDVQNQHVLEFPLTYLHGTCLITISRVDVNGDRPDLEAWYDIARDEFRGMAGWVIRQCVQSIPPLRGFITRNLSNTVDYLKLPTATLLPGTWPLSATFFTVAVTTDQELYGGGHMLPGDYDPATGGAIFNSLYEILLNTPFDSPVWQSLNNMAERINHNWGRMGRAFDFINGYGDPWYLTPFHP